MKPLTLSMSAFGPFATTQSIDFTALGSNPLFLINGPTGAGKTTILDGICFALYGKTTGNEREGAQMRCDLADDALLTEVTFKFQLGSAMYSIRRVPEQDRAKKSGEGSTLQKSEAQLYRIDANGEQTLIVANKVSEATAEIEALTGLDVEQFRQVMVLPQGKFRELLMADSKAREQIFSQLFQTHIYKRIEDTLKAKAADIRALVKDQRSRRDGILQTAELNSDEELVAELSHLETEFSIAKNAKDMATASHQQAIKQHDGAQQLLAEFARLTGLEAEAKQLEEQKPLIEVQSQTLNVAKQAQRVKPLLDNAIAREQEAHSADRLFVEAQNALSLAQNEQTKADYEAQQLVALEQTLKETEQRVTSLSSLVPELNELMLLSKAVDDAKLQLDSTKAKGQGSKTALAELVQKRSQQEQLLPKLQMQSELLLSSQQALSQHNHMFEQFKQWQQIEAKVSASQAALTLAGEHGSILKDSYQQSQHLAKSLQLRWFQGQAAILARELKTNEPCPVCGSSEHPNPAVAHEDLPTDAQLQQAQEQEALALDNLSKARADYKGLQKQLETQQQQASELSMSLGDFVQLSLESHLEKQQLLVTNAKAAESASKQLINLQQQLTSLQQQERALNERLELEREQYREHETQLERLSGQLAEKSQRIPEDYRALDMLNQAISANEQQLTKLKASIELIRNTQQLALQRTVAANAALKAAEQTREIALQQQTKAQNALDTELNHVGFADRDNLIQALLSDARIQALSEEIEGYHRQCALNQSQLSQLKSQLSGAVIPNIEELKTQLAVMAEQLQLAEQAWNHLHARITLLKQTQSQLKLVDQKSTSLEDEYAVIGTLADVACGNTGNKISLQRFVLSVLLDDVLLAATHRLHLMSKGRYRLLRKEDRSKGNKASGLELEVEDAYTSKVRPVATLSGGESFMAALSMALGLSDVVQAYAGGIKLDTLFIDEGFGSLDQDSLELAIRTLVDLQSAGRMIGVISHVTEMKEQIGSRIDILKNSHGSEIRLILP
ncbi:SMC family ATPase [Shewanella sp. A25]|nr:SMC family ATPase [Shewanella shenzhenensis]